MNLHSGSGLHDQNDSEDQHCLVLPRTWRNQYRPHLNRPGRIAQTTLVLLTRCRWMHGCLIHPDKDLPDYLSFQHLSLKTGRLKQGAWTYIVRSVPIRLWPFCCVSFFVPPLCFFPFASLDWHKEIFIRTEDNNLMPAGRTGFNEVCRLVNPFFSIVDRC